MSTCEPLSYINMYFDKCEKESLIVKERKTNDKYKCSPLPEQLRSLLNSFGGRER